VKDLNGKAHKEPQFKQKILADLGQLESVERRWLASILAGMITSAINLLIFLPHIGEILSGQPVVIPLFPLLVAIVAVVVLLVMSLAAFTQYFSLDLRFSVRRGMVIKKRDRD
jgi:uncharacterized membrane protein YphA (DoxX/SURF4 family)